MIKSEVLSQKLLFVDLAVTKWIASWRKLFAIQPLISSSIHWNALVTIKHVSKGNGAEYHQYICGMRFYTSKWYGSVKSMKRAQAYYDLGGLYN